MTDGAGALTAPRLSPARPFAERLSDAAPALAIFALLAAIPALAEIWGGGYLTTLAMRAMILAMAAISLELLIGRAGLVSFGHAAFVGLGAYVAGIMITEGVVDAVTILATTVLIAATVAAVTGAISLRTSGVYFIMITLAFGQMLFFGATSLSDYGGDDGLTLWERADFYGAGVLDSDLGLYAVVLGALIATQFGSEALSSSRFGRVLRAARENETRVAALGYNVFAYRLTAYVIAAVVAAIAGFLLANHAEFVSPAYLSWQRSGDLIVIVVLGGVGSRHGALIGAVAFIALEETLSNLMENWKLVFGPLLILIALHANGGIARLLGPRRGASGHG